MVTTKLHFVLTLCLVLGNVVGTGIYILPSTLAAYGSISLVAWVVTGFGALCLALVFARLNSRFPASGGPYVYAREGLGPFAGFVIAYSYWVGLWVTNAAIVVSCVNYLGVLFPVLNEQTPLYQPGLALALKIGCVWFFTWVNTCGIRVAGMFEVFLTVLKLTPLLLISIVSLFYFDPQHLVPINRSGEAPSLAILHGAAICLWAFMGLETATIPAEEVSDSRTVYRATVYGTLLAAGMYIFCTVALFGLLPAETLQHSPYPFSDAARYVFGDTMAYFTSLCAALAGLGALNVSILLQGQIPWVAARDGFFPALFLRQNTRQTPVWGLVISSVFITVLLIMTWRASLLEQFTRISLLATFAALLTYTITAAVELKCLWHDGWQRIRVWHIGVGGIAFLYAGWMFWGLGEVVLRDGILFLLTTPVMYRWMCPAARKSRS